MVDSNQRVDTNQPQSASLVQSAIEITKESTVSQSPLRNRTNHAISRPSGQENSELYKKFQSRNNYTTEYTHYNNDDPGTHRHTHMHNNFTFNTIHALHI